jgi:hypothetical protein
MKILIAAVSEHAWVENGCLSLSRAFDSINADSFPYILARISIALRLLIARSEAGEHKLSISLADSDGKKLMHSDLNINLQPPESSVPESSFSFALNGQNVAFPKPGDYAVDILIDGRVEASIPIYVMAKNSPTL